MLKTLPNCVPNLITISIFIHVEIVPAEYKLFHPTTESISILSGVYKGNQLAEQNYLNDSS